MARPLRIDFKNAYHHVMVKIIDNHFWLSSVKYKQILKDFLIKTTFKFDTKIIAYAIMDNHLHLILKSGKVSISKFMQVLLSSFAMEFNRQKQRQGHLFSNRFKSFLIEDGNYLITAIRYVLQNPVRAGIVNSPTDYQWSSINEYFSQGITLGKFVKNDIEEIFGSKESFYQQMGIYDESIFAKPKVIKQISAYGSQEYLENIIKLFLEEQRKQARQESSIQEETIIQFVESEYKVPKTLFLAIGKERIKSKSRNLLAFLLRRYKHLSLKDIGLILNLSESMISTKIRQMLSDLEAIQIIETKFLRFIQN